MTFWEFWDVHWFLAWCALLIVWGVCSNFTRMFMVLLRGWPPAHLDADGDWRPERDDEKQE